MTSYCAYTKKKTHSCLDEIINSNPPKVDLVSFISYLKKEKKNSF